MERIFYLAQVVQGVYALMCVAFGLCLGLFIVFGIIGCNCKYEDDDLEAARNWWKWMRRAALVAFIGCLGMIFIPTKQTYLFMVGGKVVDEAVASNPQVKELPGNTLDLLNEYIKMETNKVREKSQKEYSDNNDR